MKAVLAALLIVAGCAPAPASLPLAEVPVSVDSGGEKYVILVDSDALDFVAVFSDSEQAKAWCIRHALDCRGYRLEVK